MLNVKVWIFFILSSVFVGSLCQTIECNWGAEFICGDKCVLNENPCYCGRDIILETDIEVHVCCNNGTCFEDMTDGSVRCNGLRKTWREPCNGACKQTANNGFTTVSCENNEQCVEEIALCRGAPLCAE